MASRCRPDLLRLSATELQTLLRNGDLTSVDLVRQSLEQIQRHNWKGLSLRALISVAPEDLLLRNAAKLDDERTQGILRGPFHGIPVLVKDSFITHSDLGMPTTCGSFALLKATANKSAAVVDKLIERGLIVIAKTNLNEWASWKAMGPMNGWSAVGGQTRSAHFEGAFDHNDGVMGHSNPCGSSSGSAVGVAAGFSPLSIGTEVEGSLVQPAARAGLYSLKPTIGSCDLDGVFAVSEDFDSTGAMAKSALDAAILTEYVLNEGARSKLPKGGYAGSMADNFEGLKIGFADPAAWYWPENLQPKHGDSENEMRSGYMQVIERVRANKGVTHFPVTLPNGSDFLLDGIPASALAIGHVFKRNMDLFLSQFSHSEVRTLEDVIQYNKEHADEEFTHDFPEQDKLIHALENPVSSERAREGLDHARRVGGPQGIDEAMAKHDLNLIALPMDSPCCRLAACAGYPIATVPVGVLSYGNRPFGLAIIAKAGREDLLFIFMSAFEKTSQARPVPTRLGQ